MGTGSLIGGLIVVAFILLIILLLRRHQLREKYAVLWIVIGLGILSLIVFPELLYWAAQFFGIKVPTNLLFSATLVLLLGVCLHLAWEMSRAEDRIRRLSEEIALLRLKVGHLEEHHPAQEPDGSDRHD